MHIFYKFHFKKSPTLFFPFLPLKNQGSIFAGSPEGRRQYDREEAFDKKRAINRSETEGQGKTRPKKKVEGGSDVEDGEVEDAVDSDAGTGF